MCSLPKQGAACFYDNVAHTEAKAGKTKQLANVVSSVVGTQKECLFWALETHVSSDG